MRSPSIPDVLDVNRQRRINDQMRSRIVPGLNPYSLAALLVRRSYPRPPVGY
jgi:hypothetical protein